MMPGANSLRYFFCHQIGFLSEWQLYAQKIEGDSWVGEKIDEVKLQKMSGKFVMVSLSIWKVEQVSLTITA